MVVSKVRYVGPAGGKFTAGREYVVLGWISPIPHAWAAVVVADTGAPTAVRNIGERPGWEWELASVEVNGERVHPAEPER